MHHRIYLCGTGCTAGAGGRGVRDFYLTFGDKPIGDDTLAGTRTRIRLTIYRDLARKRATEGAGNLIARFI